MKVFPSYSVVKIKSDNEYEKKYCKLQSTVKVLATIIY